MRLAGISFFPQSNGGVGGWHALGGTPQQRPHRPAGKASALVVGHDSVKMPGRPGAAARKLSSGNSVAQAGARPVRNQALQGLGPGWPPARTAKLKGPEA